MTSFTVCLLSFIAIVNSQMDAAKIMEVLKVMHMRNCLITCPVKESTIKKLLTQGSETGWAVSQIEGVKDFHLRSNGIFMCADDEIERTVLPFMMFSRYARFHDWIIYGSDFENVKKKVDINIDERVYFLDKKKLLLSERYSINNHTVDNIVGHLESGKENILFNRTMKESFVARRSNFYGLVLKAVTGRQPPYMDYNVRLNNTSSLPGNTLTNISGVIKVGLFNDMLSLMQNNLNFSTETFIRHDGKWGNILPSGKWNGMVGSLVDGEADIATGTLTMLLERSEAVAFLPAISKDPLVLIIKKHPEALASWKAFLQPFSPKLWISIFATPLVTLVFIKSFQKYYNQRYDKHHNNIFPFNVIAEYWAIFASYLGRDPTEIIFREKLSLRLIMFSTFLLGSVLFMSYNGALTSILAVRERKLPFTSLEGLLQSPYSLITNGKGTLEYMFRNAKKGGIFNDLFQQKMEQNPEKSFEPNNDAVFDILNRSNEIAYYGELGNLMSLFPLYGCEFEIPWRSKYPNEISMALPKNSPLFQFLQLEVMRHTEMGTLARLERIWVTERRPFCPDRKDLSLGFEKLVSLFAMLAAGVLISCVIFVVEFWRRKCQLF